MRWLVAWVVLAVATRAAVVGAVPLDALDPSRDWRLGALRFVGNHTLERSVLLAVMLTKPRPWFVVWRSPPPFDPVAFRSDLERLRQLYRSRGYYTTRIAEDIELPATGSVITAVVYVEEGDPVLVERVDVDLRGEQLPDPVRTALLEQLPVRRGRIFTQDAYDRAFGDLRTAFRERGYARVRVTKAARVDVTARTATVTYTVESGPSCVFGDVGIEGTQKVEPAVVRAELPLAPGDPFRQSALERGRANLAATNLFSTIRIEEDQSDDPQVGIRVRLTEAPPHEVRLGIGYDTDEQVRGLASWRDYNFLGGGRQLGFSGRVSQIRRSLAGDFLQPHFPGRADRVRLLLLEQQEDEPSFTLDRSRGSPRIEWQPTGGLLVYGFYRFEYDSLSGVSNAIRRAVPNGAPSNGLLSGFGFGTEYNATDDPLDPTRGWTASGLVEPVGGLLGGRFNFVRASGESRVYQPLGLGFGGAARIRLGVADPYGRGDEVPLFERFYAGGINSVRGYERWRVGPLVNDDPIGGRSVVEWSVELRHPITEQIGGALFLDAGQVSRASFDLPFDSLRYGTGFGVRYKSPVGPLRVDLGFPVQPPDGDPRWQVHVSVGAAF